MSTNIGVLRQTVLSGGFFVATNADWDDVVTFFQPAPNDQTVLDLTGIAFYQQVRLAAGDATVLLDLSTDNGLLINGGLSGQLIWNVKRARPSVAPFYYTELLAPLAASNPMLVTDILAVGDGEEVNLFGKGSGTINIVPGITLRR